jgi:hypothetical protein
MVIGVPIRLIPIVAVVLMLGRRGRALTARPSSRSQLAGTSRRELHDRGLVVDEAPPGTGS